MSSPARPRTVLPKADVLAALFGSWDDIDRLMSDVTEEQWRTASPLPGWSIHSVVAHMVGTELSLLGRQTPESDIEVSALDHVRNSIGEMNEAWIRHLDALSGAELLEEFRAVTDERRAVLTAMGPDEWDAVGFTPAGPDSYGRFMRIRAFDCWMHEQDLRDGLDRSASDADLDSSVARAAFDEMASGMGFVVGKLGGAPEGSRVAIELTGPLARMIRVAVEGRAAVVEDFGGAEPTATIELDAIQFCRLCGGRPLTHARPKEINYGGDAEVGRRIVAKLNYVI